MQLEVILKERMVVAYKSNLQIIVVTWDNIIVYIPRLITQTIDRIMNFHYMYFPLAHHSLSS